MKNLFLRLFSVGVAIVLWYFVNSESNLTLVGFSAPIEIRDLSKDKVVTSQSSRQAHVAVKGPSFLVSKLSAAPPGVRIRVPKDAESRYVAPLLKSELDLPPSVQIVSIEPSEVKFTFDKLAKKKVPVVVPRIGALGDSHIVREVNISPSEIEIAGPEGELVGVTSIETYPLDFRTATNDFTRILNIRVPGSHIEAEENQVSVSVDIDLVILERQVPAVPVEIRGDGNAARWKTNPPTVVVEVSGARELIKALQSSAVKAYVDADDLTEGKTVSVKVDVPTGTHVTKTEPSQIKIVRAVVPAPQKKK